MSKRYTSLAPRAYSSSSVDTVGKVAEMKRTMLLSGFYIPGSHPPPA